MNRERRVSFPGIQQYDSNGAVIRSQASLTGGAVNLVNGMTDTDGFMITIAPSGTEGLLKVILFEDETDTPVVLPFYKGWDRNPIILKKIVVDAGNTATDVYWVK